MSQFGVVDRLTAPFTGGALGKGIDLNRVVVLIVSLSSTTLLTNALGFPFWWLAARQFSPSAVGIAAAAISAMSLLGSTSALGLGALLIRELPRHPGHDRYLVTSAAVATAVMSLVLGLGFALASGLGGGDLRPLRESPAAVLVFVAGISIMGLTNIADASVIGLLRGELQFGRNAVFATGKLVLLAVLGGMAARSGLKFITGSWMSIYAVWALASLGSLVLLVFVAGRRHILPPASIGPKPSIIGFWPSAAGHFGLNLSLQLPVFGMPILVVALGGATANAQFYIAWLLASLATVVPYSISSTLYAVGARAPEALRRQVQLTLTLCALTAVGAVVGLALLGGLLLSVFGATYADGQRLVVLLALSSLPAIVKNHYHVLLRIHGRLRLAVVTCAMGAVAELIAASMGYRAGGLPGLAIGWLAAQLAEAALMALPIPGLRTWSGPPPAVAGAGEDL